MTFDELPVGAWFGWAHIDDVPMQKVSTREYYSSDTYLVFDVGDHKWTKVVPLDMNFVTVS